MPRRPTKLKAILVSVKQSRHSVQQLFSSLCLFHDKIALATVSVTDRLATVSVTIRIINIGYSVKRRFPPAHIVVCTPRSKAYMNVKTEMKNTRTTANVQNEMPNETVCHFFLRTLKGDPQSELHYDPKTRQCYRFGSHNMQPSA